MKVKIVDKESNNYQKIYTQLGPKFFMILGAVLLLLSLIIKVFEIIIVPILIVVGLLLVFVGAVNYLVSVLKNNIKLK